MNDYMPGEGAPAFGPGSADAGSLQKERLKNHINYLFLNAPSSPGVHDLKEELLSNCCERYDDLVTRGMPAEDAYQSVIGSIGNVDDLLGSLQYAQPLNSAYESSQNPQLALIKTLAVGLYVLAGVALFLGVFLGYITGKEDFFTLLFLVISGAICIVLTCMLVYSSHRYPKYKKQNDTMVENFRQWSSDSGKNKEIKKALASLLWMLTAIIYLLVSFVTRAWYITWIIFLIASCLQTVLNLAFSLRGDRRGK